MSAIASTPNPSKRNPVVDAVRNYALAPVACLGGGVLGGVMGAVTPDVSIADGATFGCLGTLFWVAADDMFSPD